MTDPSRLGCVEGRISALMLETRRFDTRGRVAKVPEIAWRALQEFTKAHMGERGDLSFSFGCAATMLEFGIVVFHQTKVLPTSVAVRAGERHERLLWRGDAHQDPPLRETWGVWGVVRWREGLDIDSGIAAYASMLLIKGQKRITLQDIVDFRISLRKNDAQPIVLSSEKP